MRLEILRDPSEQPILVATLLVILAVFLLAAAPTLCLLPLGVILLVIVAFQMNQAHHRAIIQNALRVSSQTAPELAQLAAECGKTLNSGPFELYVLRARQMNAYTFGFSNPRVVVLYSPLLQVMDARELRFIIGHELGHVVLNHTWLTTLLGGIAGVPPSLGAAVIFTFAFRWWSRACEYSSDRAGLVACGSLEKATSALVKLAAGELDSPAEIERALRLLDTEDDSPVSALGESLATHPLIINRIEKLRKFAASKEYRELMEAKPI
ncbi:MAG: M48 family metallopeptidase [Bellilinea sp.]